MKKLLFTSLVVISFFGVVNHSHASIGYVLSATHQGISTALTSASVTTSTPVQQGALGIFCSSHETNANITSLVDNLGDAWTLATTTGSAASPMYQEVWYTTFKNSALWNATATLNTGGGYWNVSMSEYNGFLGTPTLDVSGQGHGNSTAMNATTTSANAPTVDYSCVSNFSNGDTQTAGSGYTKRFEITGNDTQAVEDRFPGANGSHQNNWTTGAGINWGVIGAEFYDKPLAAVTGWNYYRAITVTSTGSIASGTLSNFPMLVSSTISSWETTSTGGHISNLCTNPNGIQEPCDLIFTATLPTASGSTYSCTPTNFETEHYVSSTGEIEDWVLASTMATATTMYSCYGNSAVTTDQSRSYSTWDNNYMGVWHLPTPTSTLQANDSTANINNATSTASATSTTGEIDGGSLFNGSSAGGINIATSTSLLNVYDSRTSTFSGWINGTNWNSQSTYDILLFQTAATKYGLAYRGGGSGVWFYNNGAIIQGPVLSTSTWHYVVATENGAGAGNASLFVDGAFYATGTPGFVATSTGLQIGSGTIASANISLDELRLSNIPRSPSWILTEYNNQFSPSTFYSVGSEQSNSSSTTSTAPLVDALFFTGE